MADGRRQPLLAGSDEFSRLIGSRTAAAFGRLWRKNCKRTQIDPEGKIAAAVATRGTWAASLSTGLPTGPARGFPSNCQGFRYSTANAISRVIAFRRLPRSGKVSLGSPRNGAMKSCIRLNADLVCSAVQESITAESDAPVETPQNILPFRPVSEPKSPALTVVESKAFDELAAASRLNWKQKTAAQ